MGWNGCSGEVFKPVTVSGPVCTFNSQYALPLKSHKIALTATQSGSGTPSPDNIRPIIGHSAINIGSDAKYAGFINYNQIVGDTYTTTTFEGITTSYDSATNEYSIRNDSRTAKYNTGSTQGVLSAISPQVGHIYYADIISDDDVEGVLIGMAGYAVAYNYPFLGALTSYPAGYPFYLRVDYRYDFVNLHPIGDITKCKIVLMDLTEMFGAGNEPTTIEEFKALFPYINFAYNAGTLTTVSAVNGVSNSMFTILCNTGINQWNEQWENGAYSVSDGSKINSGVQIRNKTPIRVIGGQTYYVATSVNCYILTYDSNMNYIEYFLRNNQTIQFNNNVAYICFYTQSGYSVYGNDISFNYPSTDTTYHSYAEGNIYFGTYNAKTGVLAATHKGVNMGELTWSLPGSYFITNGVKTDILSPVDGNTLPEVMCDNYKPITWNQSADYAVQIGPQSYRQYVGQVWVKNPDYTSAADFKTAMSGHYLVYKLATPQTIQLPPCPIDTLLGENNIFADTGDTTLQYMRVGR